MKNNKKFEDLPQLQLELPDYSLEYLQWKEKQEVKKEENTVIIIDIH